MSSRYPISPHVWGYPMSGEGGLPHLKSRGVPHFMLGGYTEGLSLFCVFFFILYYSVIFFIISVYCCEYEREGKVCRDPKSCELWENFDLLQELKKITFKYKISFSNPRFMKNIY